MSMATFGSAGAGRDRNTDDAGPGAWRWILAAVVLAVLGLLIAWFAGWFRPATDPRVAEIRALQEEARAKFAANGGPSTMAEATAFVASTNAIREKIEALPEPLRRQVEQQGGGMMRGMFGGRIDAYFAAPPAKRQAELDRQIDQEEIMRKAFEAGSAVANAAGGGRRDSGGGGGPPRDGSQDDRNRWRKNMIDRTSPEERARYAEYRRAMEERREKRGLPSGGPR